MSVVDISIGVRTRGRQSVGFAARLPRVEIGAWDLFTPFGALTQTWDALLSGRFISDHARCVTGGAPSQPRAMDLAHRAAERIAGPGLEPDAALIVGTSKGTVDSWLPSARRASGARPTTEGLSDVAASLASRYKLRGPRLTVSAACASGLHALIRGAMMIQAGEVRQALVVATEASVHPLFLGSFQRLGVLARPEIGCRPFDRNREGFLMSEAAAAVLLEADGSDLEADGSDDARPDRPETPRPTGRGISPIFLDRFALAADATHLTGGDPDARVLRHLLARVIDGRPVDLVHAHGTGTVANDEMELAAIEASVAETSDGARPVLYSHKGALGHSLGAAGLLSVVLNCQAHATGVIPPNAQTHTPLATKAVTLSRDPVRRNVCRSLAVAAGFGGAMAAVSLIS